MANEFIVAIELGSSKMTGMAGRKNPDGSISVLAAVKEDAASCIRKGVVYNIDKTAVCLTNIINKLKMILKTEISQVYVGVGGQSIRSVKNVIQKDLPADTIVSQELVNEIMDINRGVSYPDYEILDAITLEYKVDSQYQIDPVGIQSSHLEGNFLNILWRKSFYRSLNKCFDNAGIAIAEMYLSPLAMADAVLTETEKRSGCMLVDLGADTTTVSVYYRDILRHIAVIPLGSGNVTKDIESLQMDEAGAEKMKLKYGCAYTDNCDIDDTLKLPIDQERSVDSRVFIEIVEARVKEIVENVWAQVPIEYSDKLLGGVILTGGGSNMSNIDTVFRQTTHIEKVRISKFVHANITPASPKVVIPHDGTMNTICGLLIKGDMNCAGDAISNDIFGSTQPAGTSGNVQRPSGTPGNGVINRKEEEERRKKEEEERHRKEEEERRAKAEQEEKERKELEEKKKNSSTNKFKESMKKFFKSLVAPEDQ